MTISSRSLVLSSLLLAALASDSRAAAPEWGVFQLLGRHVASGSKLRTAFSSEDTFARDVLDANVLVARGNRPGPTLCLTGAVHGRELNGVEIARQAFEEVDASWLSGTLIAIPIVSTWGFRSANRYVADRRDLNRAFPGREKGQPRQPYRLRDLRSGDPALRRPARLRPLSPHRASIGRPERFLRGGIARRQSPPAVSACTVAAMRQAPR